MRTSRETLTAIGLIALGWALYGVSFLLPAYESPDLSGPGYDAFVMSLILTSGFFHGAIFLLPCALAFLGNLFMLLSALAAVAPPGKVMNAVPHALFAVIPVNVAAGFLNPLNLASLHDGRGLMMHLGVGFWLWNVSYPIVAVGLLRRREVRDRTVADTLRPAVRPARPAVNPHGPGSSSPRPVVAGSAPGRRAEPGLPG
jgi:hypothetical protein